MKNLTNIFAAFVVLVTMVGTSFAGTDANADTDDAQAKVGILTNAVDDRVIVALNNDGTAPYWVSIMDAKGNTLHQEQVSNPGLFSKRYDLAELVDGEYQVKVCRGDQVSCKETIFRK